MAMTRKPCEAISDKKFTCSHGEFAQAPLPQAMIGSLFLPPKAIRSVGRNTVCVGSLLSDAIKALKGPVPPSSIIRLAVSVDATGAGLLTLAVWHPLKTTDKPTMPPSKQILKCFIVFRFRFSSVQGTKLYSGHVCFARQRLLKSNASGRLTAPCRVVVRNSAPSPSYGSRIAPPEP